MSLNESLRRAKRQRNDEFYTQRSDIENELRHYTRHFRGKVVYCNCDDPRISNFFHYFSYNFERLGLKKLVTACYRNQERDLFSRHDSERAIWLEYAGNAKGDRVPDVRDIGVREFEGDGDFRSAECVELLTQADIVVTNPPFSLFREYVAQLVQYGKKFLIVGSQNAITYKEIFPLIKDNRMWLGVTPKGQDMLFDVPEGYAQELVATGKEGSAYRVVEGVVKGRLGNAAWFTNLDHEKRHQNRKWALVPEQGYKMKSPFKVTGAEFTTVGKELLHIVDMKKDDAFLNKVQAYFRGRHLDMVALPSTTEQ